MYDPTYKDRSWIYRLILVAVLAVMICGLWILMQPPPPPAPIISQIVVIR